MCQKMRYSLLTKHNLFRKNVLFYFYTFFFIIDVTNSINSYPWSKSWSAPMPSQSPRIPPISAIKLGMDGGG